MQILFMTRFQAGLARITALISAIIFWIWATLKFVFTLLGATTAGDDLSLLIERFPAIVNWLYLAPAWAPALPALILTFFLVWLSWPAANQNSAAYLPRSNIAAIKTDKIMWSFEETAMQMRFLGMTYSSGSETKVLSFQAEGRNISDESIKYVFGLIRSDITNREFKIYFNIEGMLFDPNDTYGIPPKSTFQISSEPFYSDESLSTGINESKFINDFSSFTFEFNYDGVKYKKKFTRNDIDQNLAWFKNTIEPQKSATPRVTKKPNAKPLAINIFD